MNFVYRPDNVGNPHIPKAQNATIGVKFSPNLQILNDYWLVGGTKWSRFKLRLRHPIVYFKRGLRNIYYKIKRMFVKPKMIQPLAKHPYLLAKPICVCHGCHQEQENTAQSDQKKPRVQP